MNRITMGMVVGSLLFAGQAMAGHEGHGGGSYYAPQPESTWDMLQRDRERSQYQNQQREQEQFQADQENARRQQWRYDQQRDPNGYNRRGDFNTEPPPLGYCCEYVPNHGARR
jgi:delta 1-pyrroline-5-carboxylate dehydrogenase